MLDQFLARIFLRELDRQARFGIIATGDLAEAVRLPRPDEDRFWYSVQNFLVAAGNISKLLWPPDKKHAARGAELRRLLAVPDDSPLALRIFRNHFEHYDERLEQWLGERTGGDYVDSNIGALGSDGKILGVLQPHQVMRHFDPSDWSVVFRGDRYLLRPVQRAVLDISSRVSAAEAALRERAPERT